MIFFILFTLLNIAHGLEPRDLPRIEYNRDPYFISEGYRLGHILEFYRYRFFPWSYEGNMMIGFGSGRQEFADQYCMETQLVVANEIRAPDKRQEMIDEATTRCYIFSNPWPFSTLDEARFRAYEAIDNVSATPVLLHFVIPYISVEYLITKTKHFVEGIYPVNPRAQVPRSFALDDAGFPTASWLNTKKGFVDGRFVKASLDHSIRKSFEVTIQEGALGNNFRRMSVSEQKMFDYIIAAMLTGKQVHIGYVELLGFENSLLQIGKDYDTPYRVISVELRE